VQKAVGYCDELGYAGFKYDADGLGAGVRGDARVINEQRRTDGRKAVNVYAFRGSAGVFKPEGEDVKGRKNADFFANLKAQNWWGLRVRFQKTYRAVTQARKYSPDELISIPSKLPNRVKAVMELSQPTYSLNTAGKIVVDKTPEGTRSPNLADSIMIRFSVGSHVPMVIGDDVLRRAATPGARR
jgi:hypothetical protein